MARRDSRNPHGLRALGSGIFKNQFCKLFIIMFSLLHFEAIFAKRIWHGHVAWHGHGHGKLCGHVGGHNGVTGGSQLTRGFTRGGHSSQGGGVAVPCRHGHYTCYLLISAKPLLRIFSASSSHKLAFGAQSSEKPTFRKACFWPSIQLDRAGEK